MNKRDLLKDPCWRERDLGQALPDSPHAVSVALPRWEDVINYEEKLPSCLNKLQAIYPRFGLNPLVSEVSYKALSGSNFHGGSAWPYPTITAAKKAQEFCNRKENHAKTIIKQTLGLPCLIADEKATPSAKAFWQHTGIGASSRLAAIALQKEKAPTSLAGKNAKDILRIRIAKIYNCNPNLVTLHPSGMAALNNALEALTKLFPRRAALQLGFPYVDVLKLPQVIFEGSSLVINTDVNNFALELDKKKPAAVIVELPSNPMLQSIDLPAIASLAHSRGIPVIADDTIGSAINIDCLLYADLVFSSLTKSFAGRGDILAGALVINPKSKWKSTLTSLLTESTAPLADADAVALEEVSRDVHLRVQKLNKACDLLAQRLSNHQSVARVLHPAQCTNFKKLMRPDGGHGCLLSFELKGGLEKTKRFYDALRLCKGPSLGTNFTLVCPYVLLAHYTELGWAQECGVPSHLLRVSVGLEDPEKLWRNFDLAMQA